MRLTRFDSVDDYLAAATPFLVEREAEHNLIFGIAATVREDPGQYTGPAYLATVDDADRVVAAALQTPPFRLILSELDDPAALGLIVDDTLGLDLPGVQGPVDVVSEFVRERAARGGPSARHSESERIYRLSEVIPPRPVPGAMRVASVEDRDVIVDWLNEFMVEAFGEDDRPRSEAAADRWLSTRTWTLYLWEYGGEVVSLCGVRGATPNGIRVGPVYTPPERRSHGYASALVATASQAQLDAGKRFVFLFTDIANPISNRIYQAIGYEPVGDIDIYVFERESPG